MTELRTEEPDQTKVNQDGPVAIPWARPHENNDQRHCYGEVDLELQRCDSVPNIVGVKLCLFLFGAQDDNDDAGDGNNDTPEVALPEFFLEQYRGDYAIGNQRNDSQGRHDGSGREAVRQEVAQLAQRNQNLAHPPIGRFEICRWRLFVVAGVVGTGGLLGAEGSRKGFGFGGIVVAVFLMSIEAAAVAVIDVHGAVDAGGASARMFQGFFCSPTDSNALSMQSDVGVSLDVEGEGNKDIANNGRDDAD